TGNDRFVSERHAEVAAEACIERRRCNDSLRRRKNVRKPGSERIKTGVAGHALESKRWAGRMQHFNIGAVQRLRMRRCFTFACLAVVTLVRVVDSWPRAGEAGPPATTLPRLKPSLVLEPPAGKPSAPAPGAADRDAIFLRADRLEGEAQK